MIVGGANSAQAREDVTNTYLTDAGLENEGTNWGYVYTSGNHTGLNNGYHESWHNTFTLTQTTSTLPAGYYQLSVQVAVEGGTSTTVSLQATSGANSSVAAYPKYSTHSSYADMAAWWAADATGTGNRNLNRIFTTVYVEEGQTLTATFKQTANNQWIVYGQMQLHKLTDEEGAYAQVFEAVYNPMTNLDMAGGRFKQRFESYDAAAVPSGKRLNKTISGLPKGKYNVTLNGGASYTSGRNFDGNTGDNLTEFFANNASTNVTVYDRGNIGNNEFVDYTASGALVTDGNLEVGFNNLATGANWFVGSVKYIELAEPYISYIAEEIPAATATAMTANKWYKFIAASDGDYAFTTTTIDDIIYTTTDQLPSTATGTTPDAVMELTEGTTYYIKSTSAQTLTISPQNFTYTVGEATADKSYIQEGNTVTVTYESLGTDNPNPTLVKDFSGVTFGGNAIAVTPTANGFTFTVPTVTAATNYDLVIPAEAIGYSDGEGTYNAEQTITLHAPAVFNGTYYLYHPQTSRFLARGGSYGTAAVADFYGIPFTLTVDNEGYASMVFLDNNQGLFNGSGDDVWCWTDNAAGSYQFTIVEGGYNIKGKGTENNHYLHVSISDDYRVGFKGDATVWVLKTPEERNTIINAYPTNNKTNVITAASLTSETNAAEFATWLEDNRAAKDKTSSVGTAKITNAVGDWTWTEVRNQGGQPAYNNAAEAWCATGSWSQTITGLPEGIYKVTINAFERRANNATSYDLGEAGYGNVTSSYLKANDEQVRIKSWYEEVVKNGNNYNPNTMGEAVTAFNNDKYKSELYTYVGDDGNLTLTIAKPNYIFDCWLLWNNITLTYYDSNVSDEEATAIIAEATTEMDKPMKPSLYQALGTAKTTFDGARTVPNYNALRTAIDNTATSVASYAAMNTNYLQPVASVLSSSNVIDLTTSAYTDYIAYKAKYENYTDANTEDIENATANGLTLYQGTGARYTSIGNILLTTGWEINGSDALTDGSGFYINTWSVENDGEAPAKDFARPFYEMWVSSGSIAASTLTRTIGGLSPDGVYKVTADVRIQYTEKVDRGITMQVGTGGIAVDVTAGEKIGTTNRYIKSYEAIGKADGEGNLTINITVAENSGISWLAFKNLNYAKAVPENVTIAETETYTPVEKYANVTFNRTLVAGWNGLVLPFDMTVANVKTTFGATEVKDFTGITYNAENGVTLNFGDAETITAGKPFMVKVTSGNTSYTINNVILSDNGLQNVTKEAEGNTNISYVMKGTYAASTDLTDVDFALINGTTFYYHSAASAKASSAKAFRAYFQNISTDPEGARVSFDFGEGGTTAIQQVNNVNVQQGDVYDLQGRKVQNISRKGIYIQNGHKVVKQWILTIKNLKILEFKIMNKKAYITPLVVVTGVTTHYHICIGSVNKENPTDLEGIDDGINNDPGNFSRRRNQWEDEEEEEEY